jgi:hypothetical protein
MVGAVIVLNEPLSYLSRRCANHRIEIYIVIRFASEGLDTDRPFFQIARVAKQSLLDRICEQYGVSFAVREQWVCQKAV